MRNPSSAVLPDPTPSTLRRFRLRTCFALFVEAGEQRFLNSLRAGRRGFRAARRNFRQHRSNHFFDIAALAKENPKRLVEKNCMLMPLYEYRVKRPVEIVARADMGDAERLQRIEDRTGSYGNSRGAQRAREVEDVFGRRPWDRP